MIDLKKHEGKTVESVFNNIEKETGLKQTDIIYSISEKEGSLFKTKKVIVKFLEKKLIIEYIKELLKELSKKSIEFNFEIKEKEGSFNVMIISDDNALLIGKDGKNLNAYQKFIRQTLSTNIDLPIKFNLDISNYRAKKIKQLEYEVKTSIKKILQDGIEVKIGPLNSYERKIVHNLVSTYDELKTESINEEPNRCVIINKK